MEFHIATEKELKYCCRRLRELGRWERMYPDGWTCSEAEFAAWMLRYNFPVTVARDDSTPVVLCYLHDFEGHTGCISYFAVERLPHDTPHVFRAVVRSYFERSELVALFGHINGSNRVALHIARRVGFREAVKIPAGAADGSDLYYMIVTHEDLKDG